MSTRDDARAEPSRGPFLRTIKIVRILVIVGALVALGVFLFKIGIDPAGAGEEWGH